MAVDVGSAVGYLDLDISGFLAGLKSAQSEADTASKSIATKIGKNFSGVGGTLTSVGKSLTKYVTAPLLGVGVAGLKVATDFEKGMSEVQAVSGATGEELQALKDKAIELGSDTAFSANEVAAAMTEMAKAGWSSQQIIDGMGGVLDAAAASGEGLGVVSTIVADAITGFGLEAKDSAKIADLLTEAANSGTIGVSDLGESFKYIAPVASSMGLSVEDVTTALSAMSKAGIKGSQAGTSLRGMLTRMVKPTDAVSNAMGDLGIVLTNQDGSFKSLDTIVGEMRNSFSGLTDEQKTYYAATLAGQEGMSGLLSLLNLSQDEYDGIAEGMDNASGVAASTAAIMQNNLQSKIEQLFGSLESLAIKLADLVIPYIQIFVEWLTTLVDKFAALDPEVQKGILKFAAFAIAAGPVTTAVGKVSSGVGTLFTAFGKLSGGFKAVAAGGTAGSGVLAKLGGALAGVSTSTVAVTGVIAVLGAAFVSLWKNNEDFKTKVTGIWDQIKETFSGFAQGILDRINSLGFNFSSITEVLKSLWEGFCNFLSPIFTGAFQFIANTFKTVTDWILGVADFFIALFKGDWQGLWDAVKGIFVTVWEGIKMFFQNIGNTLIGILDVICGWFGTTWSETWNSIKTFFINIWNGIVNWFKTQLENIKKAFILVFTGIKLAISTIWNAIKDTATSIWEKIKTAITIPLTAAKLAVSNIIEGIKTKFSTTFTAIKTTVSNIFTNIKNSISTALNGAKTIVTNVIEKIKNAFDFSWSLPDLKLPHIKVTGGEAPFGIGGYGSLPKFSIEWYKKAMNNGMILDNATIFGMDSDGNFLGGGEAGSETVVGTKSLLSMIKRSVVDAIKPLIAISSELAKASVELGYVTYNGFAKFKEYKEQQDRIARRNDGSGDTFIFNSPKAIDEIEAAKQMKKAKRDLAEGF